MLVFLAQLFFVGFLTVLSVYYSYKINIVDVCFWNCLSEALGYNQFLTNGGDSMNLDFDKRKYSIANRIFHQLRFKRIVALVEVDNYPWLITYLNEHYPEYNIKGFCCAKVDPISKSNTNLSIYVSSRLNKFDNNFEVTTKLKGDKLRSAYQKLVEMVENDLVGKIEHKIYSFKDQGASQNYIDCVSDIIGMNITMDMPYVSFDCSAIVWSANYFTAKKVLSNSNSYGVFSNKKLNFEDQITFENSGFTMDDNGFFGVRFLKKAYVPFYSWFDFDVFVAHIKSGKKQIDEYRRVESTNEILTTVKTMGLKNHIICMDSNTCRSYRNEISKGEVKNKNDNIVGNLNYFFDEMLTYHHYMNIISPNKDTMCFKLRVDSGQNDKDGELMGVTIDAFIVPFTTHFKTFVPYNSNFTDEDYSIIKNWCNNSKYSNIFKNVCTGNHLAFPRWTKNIEDNVLTHEVAYELWKANENQTEKLDDEQVVKNVNKVLKKLLPNTSNPSDHPMIGCRIFLH